MIPSHCPICLHLTPLYIVAVWKSNCALSPFLKFFFCFFATHRSWLMNPLPLSGLAGRSCCLSRSLANRWVLSSRSFLTPGWLSASCISSPACHTSPTTWLPSCLVGVAKPTLVQIANVFIFRSIVFFFLNKSECLWDIMNIFFSLNSFFFRNKMEFLWDSWLFLGDFFFEIHFFITGFKSNIFPRRKLDASENSHIFLSPPSRKKIVRGMK